VPGCAAAGRPVIGLTASLGDDGSPRCGEAYIRSIGAAGGIPVVLPPTPDAEALAELRYRLDGIVLTGGGDIDPSRYGACLHPETALLSPVREAWDLALAEHLLAWPEMPFLAICLGIQELNVAAGGTLFQHLPDRAGGLEHRAPATGERWHSAQPVSGTRLASIVGVDAVQVNTRHHQALDRIGAGLMVSAVAPDGVVEAVEIPGPRFALGVQWHPERLLDTAVHERIFFDFVDACRRHQHRDRPRLSPAEQGECAHA